MPRTKKESRNGKEHDRNTSNARGRGGNSSARTAGARPAKASEAEALLEVTVQPEGLNQFREAREHLADIIRQAKDARANARELSDAVRQAREDVNHLVRYVTEARRELDELRGRDARPAAETSKRAGRKTRERVERVEARNRLGVTVGSGVVVAEVLSNSPAVKAGLVRGDVIEAVNGSPVVSATQLRDAVHKTDADADVLLRVIHAGSSREARIRLGKSDRADDGAEGRNRLGVTVGPGVVVAEVLPDTPAATAGLRPSDVIDEVNGTAVISAEQLRDVVQQLPSGSEAVLRVTRAGKAKDVRARLNGVAKEESGK